MFRNDTQRGAVCKTLLGRINQGHLWDSRPTEEAILALEGRRNLSSGELTVLKVAFDIWDPTGCRASIGEVLSNLDRPHQEAIYMLLLAINTQVDPKGLAIDHWISRYA